MAPPDLSDRVWAGVGFDLDGTLFDHRGSAATAVARFIRRLGRFPSPELEEMWFELEAEHFEAWRDGSITFGEQRRRRLRAFLALLEVPSAADDVALDGLFDEYLLAYRAAWRPFADARPLLARLRAQGTRIGLLTNGNHVQQVDKLDVTGLAPLIDVVCTSESIGAAKPDPSAFEHLAARLGVPPRGIAFIGDNPIQDIAGARSAGMHAGLVDHASEPGISLEDALRSARAS